MPGSGVRGQNRCRLQGGLPLWPPGGRRSQKMGALVAGACPSVVTRSEEVARQALAETTEAGFQPLDNSGKSKTRRSGFQISFPDRGMSRRNKQQALCDSVPGTIFEQGELLPCGD